MRTMLAALGCVLVLVGSAEAQGVVAAEAGVALASGGNLFQAGVRIDGAKPHEVALFIAAVTFPDFVGHGAFPALIDIDLTYHARLGGAVIAVYGGVSAIEDRDGTGSGVNGGVGVVQPIGTGVAVRADFIMRRISVNAEGLSGRANLPSLSLGLVLGN